MTNDEGDPCQTKTRSYGTLVTADQPTSGKFFSELFGWTRKEVDAGPFGIYTLFQKNGQDVAGMMNSTPDTPGKGSVAAVGASPPRVSAGRWADRISARYGLHVVFGSNQGVYLRRAATKEPSLAYRPVADSRAEAFEEALNTGGERGFRVMPETLTRSGNDTAAIMRRTPSGSASYRYRVLAADSAFDKNVNDLASKGFSAIGVFTQQSGMAASLGWSYTAATPYFLKKRCELRLYVGNPRVAFHRGRWARGQRQRIR